MIPTKSFDQKTIDECYDICHKKTRIEYRYKGNFFKPGFKNINYLQTGRSKIISSPITITVELFFAMLDYVKHKIVEFRNLFFPRLPKIFGEVMDSNFTGRLVFGKRKDDHIPIHHMHVELWGRTWFWQWRKLSEGISDRDGYFTMPFDLTAARSWWIRTVHFEVYQTQHVFYQHNKPRPHFELFHKIIISPSDFIGMEYTVGILQLFYWEYRDDTELPRVVIKDFDNDAPQYYSEGRNDAISQQFIPIEITKQKHLMQLKMDPESLTLAEIQDDYPINLTQAMEKMHPGITRCDEWFGMRMMNGMNMATFMPDKVNPEHYWVKYFGACLYDINNEYAFPTAEIKFKLRENGYPLPFEIHFTGALNAFNTDRFQKHVFTPADGEKWEQAKRIARVNAGLCTELDEHLTATHLNVEQYAIAAFRNMRESPIASLLFPHLKEVVLVNHTADRILLREYIPNASALTGVAIAQRTKDLLGVQDWKNWKPMEVISEVHTYAKAENLFWKILRQYVDYFFEKNLEDIKNHWHAVYCFSNDIVAHSVPLFHTTIDLNSLSPAERARHEARLEYYNKQYRLDMNLQRDIINGEVKTISPITHSFDYDESKPEEIQNLKDSCCYIIMMATFLHTWANEHQNEDIGEVLYNCLGLRFGDKETGVMAPESDLSIAPDLTRSTQMMWFSNLLSRTEYGFIESNEEGDIDIEFVNLLKAHEEEFLKYKVYSSKIESRTNI